MKNTSLIFLVFTLIPFSACVKEDIKIDLVIADENGAFLKAPCTYVDSVFTTNQPGLSGAITINLKEGASSDSLYLKLNDTTSFVIIYKEPGGFKTIPHHVIKFNQNSTKVTMEAAITGNKKKKYLAYQGVLYIVVQPDKSVKIDWCSVSLRDGNQGYLTSSGGCHLVF